MKHLIIPSILVVIIYLFYSAIVWDLNPGNWIISTRIICGITMLVAIGVGFVLDNVINNSDNE